MAILKVPKEELLAIALLFAASAGAHATVPVIEMPQAAGALRATSSGPCPTNGPDVRGAVQVDEATFGSFVTPSPGVFPSATGTGMPASVLSGSSRGSFIAAAGNRAGYVSGITSSGGCRYSYTVSAVPEVGTWVMPLVGIALIAYQLRRKSKARRPWVELRLVATSQQHMNGWRTVAAPTFGATRSWG
jgi:hypothetical protein